MDHAPSIWTRYLQNETLAVPACPPLWVADDQTIPNISIPPHHFWGTMGPPSALLPPNHRAASMCRRRKSSTRMAWRVCINRRPNDETSMADTTTTQTDTTPVFDGPDPTRRSAGVVNDVGIIHTYIHACMHTYITLHYIAFHCIALHYITLHKNMSYLLT